MGDPGFYVRDDYRILSRESFKHNPGNKQGEHYKAKYRYCPWEVYDACQEDLVDFVFHGIDHRHIDLEPKVQRYLDRHKTEMKVMSKQLRRMPFGSQRSQAVAKMDRLKVPSNYLIKVADYHLITKRITPTEMVVDVVRQSDFLPKEEDLDG